MVFSELSAYVTVFRPTRPYCGRPHEVGACWPRKRYNSAKNSDRVNKPLIDFILFCLIKEAQQCYGNYCYRKWLHKTLRLSSCCLQSPPTE